MSSTCGSSSSRSTSVKDSGILLTIRHLCDVRCRGIVEAIWEDILTVEGRELFYAYQVDNQAIVVPETIDAIRALTKGEGDGSASIAKTDAAMGIGALHG